MQNDLYVNGQLRYKNITVSRTLFLLVRLPRLRVIRVRATLAYIPIQHCSCDKSCQPPSLSASQLLNFLISMPPTFPGSTRSSFCTSQPPSLSPSQLPNFSFSFSRLPQSNFPLPQFPLPHSLAQTECANLLAILHHYGKLLHNRCKPHKSRQGGPTSAFVFIPTSALFPSR